jgi:signal transduction histidine kinase
MPASDQLDRAAARGLTRRYALALGLVALLTLLAQAVIQVALHRARADAEVVNLAGRQRMLSQRLCKAALAWRTGGDPARLAETRQVLDEWTRAHLRLSRGDDLPNAGAGNSPAVAREFVAVEARVQAMAAAARALTEQPAAVDRLLDEEAAFLTGMERVVALYQGEAQARVARLVRLELGLCGLLLLVLMLEAVLVFRPAVRRLRQAIADRERLRQQELESLGHQVAADTARGIGQDLHDGLGQTLTALSFQARTLAQASAGGPAAADADALASGIAEAIGQCRAHSRRLSPVDIQAAGLEAALRELADAITRAAGVACTLGWDAGNPPPAAAGEDLYRITQEAVTNALRHGRARRITIAVSAQGLTVQDDGQGGTGGGEGVGTRSMRARCARLGAELESGPAAAGGWLVRVRIPAAHLRP